jgi:TolB-like protein
MRIGLAALSLLPFAAAAQGVPRTVPAGLAPTVDPGGEILLPLPAAHALPLDLAFLLKDTSLCVFPFVKESAAATDKAYLESIQRTFFDVAKQSPVLKDAVLVPQSSKCEPHDGACLAATGSTLHCQNVLVGSSAAKGNGFVLSVRIFDVRTQALLPGAEVEQVLETDRQSDVQAWAEGQACRALQMPCSGRLPVDADRKDMKIYIDNRLVQRSFRSPEQFAVAPGIHELRIAIGQRTSLAKKVAVRRDELAEMIHARQTEKGGLPLFSDAELGGQRPEPSVEYREGRWTKPVGYTIAGVGLAAAGIGIAEALHGRSLNNQANSDFARNHVYLQSDVATLDSAHGATTTANLLFAAGAVLCAAGLTTAFFF